MRFVATLLAASAIAGSAMAADAWIDFESDELGIAVQFPGTPTEWKGVYTPEIVQNIPTTVYKLETPQGSYTAMVADLTSRIGDSAILLGEAEYWLTHFGEVHTNSTSRLTQGRTYGRFFALTCDDNYVPEGEGQDIYARRLWKAAADFECPHDARLVSTMYVSKGKLIVLIGVNYPDETGDADRPAALRFAQSLAWHGPNAPFDRVQGAEIPTAQAAH